MNTLDEINKLNPKKVAQTTDIPVPVIKENKDVIALFIHCNCNKSLSTSPFSPCLKFADLRSVFKKDHKIDKEN